MNIKRDQEIMRKLKVSSMAYLILRTNMGDVHLNLRSGEDHYFLSLDSVPMEKEKEVELMAILFPETKTLTEERVMELVKEAKPKGRPKGSKNK